MEEEELQYFSYVAPTVELGNRVDCIFIQKYFTHFFLLLYQIANIHIQIITYIKKKKNL